MRHQFFGLLLIIFLFSLSGLAQKTSAPPVNIQVVSEEDTIPGVVKNLPDAENIRNRAVFIRNTAELKKALGERGVFDLIDFVGGTEAATAPYDAGKLLIVEYATPQASVDADNNIKQRLNSVPQNPPVYYRRVGNYAVFVFDAKDESAANSLIDQVKYEKSVQWLGENPFLEQQYRKANRVYLETTSSVFVYTLLSVVLGLGTATLIGISFGTFVFYRRKQQHANMTAFSDAGGMTRLNLDGLTEVTSDRLLKD